MTSLDQIILTTVDFDDDSTCDLLANLINDASAMTILKIDDQIGSRNIYVEVTEASSSSVSDGQITIYDNSTMEIISRRSTMRTTALTITQDQS